MSGTQNNLLKITVASGLNEETIRKIIRKLKKLGEMHFAQV